MSSSPGAPPSSSSPDLPGDHRSRFTRGFRGRREDWFGHISLAHASQALLVAPATANTIAHSANDGRRHARRRRAFADRAPDHRAGDGASDVAPSPTHRPISPRCATAAHDRRPENGQAGIQRVRRWPPRAAGAHSRSAAPGARPQRAAGRPQVRGDRRRHP